MGSITRSFANNITTSGVLLPASLVNNSIANVTAYNAAIATGGMKLISSQTASNSASISFTTGIDSTYKEYQFYFINIGARTNSADFGFLTSTDGGSNYGNTVTNTTFRTFHFESGTDAELGYVTDFDLSQSTGLNILSLNQGNNADDSYSGTLTLFNPSSTTYVKHFIASGSNAHDTSTPLIVNNYLAGYVNTTSAVNAVQFKFDTGNIDGIILMYGIK
jgi:hypothetical protein